MKISKEARRASREIFAASLTSGRIDSAKVRRYSDRIVEVKPRGYFQILKEYTRLIRLELSKRHAIIESATPLDEEAGANVGRDLRSRFGDDITTEYRVTPSLLGGLRVKVGSDVWDGTVFSRLQQLKNQL